LGEFAFRQKERTALTKKKIGPYARQVKHLCYCLLYNNTISEEQFKEEALKVLNDWHNKFSDSEHFLRYILASFFKWSYNYKRDKGRLIVLDLLNEIEPGIKEMLKMDGPDWINDCNESQFCSYCGTKFDLNHDKKSCPYCDKEIS